MQEALPILDILPEIHAGLAEQTTLILQAPPGAGKSTVLPLELLQAPWLAGQKILLLEPRRLAARAVATRMADLLGEKVGATVGYRIRFDHKVGPETRIEVITENILTRMLHRDAGLEGVGLVVFDEFHERSLNADLALVLSRQVQEVLREDLRLLIMSATLDTGHLSALLGNAPLINSKGRQHPISYVYLPQPAQARIHQSVAKAVRRALREQTGDILVFLPGAGEIRRTQEALEADELEIQIHPLFGDLPFHQQQAAILPDPHGQRKVVLATSIAETSLTIKGIEVVVDSGLARIPMFHPKTGLTRLETVTVTRDAADQRAGRAGRLGPGVAYRLWSEGEHLHLQAHRKPEILMADLAPLVLELTQWGVQDLDSLDWPTPPPAGALAQGKKLLLELGAIENGTITPRGSEMLRMPTHPRLAHLLLESKSLNLAALGADLGALLEERDPLPRDAGADLSLRIEALRRWRSGGNLRGLLRSGSVNRSVFQRIERLSKAWRKLLKVRPSNEPVSPTAIGRLLAAAYPGRIAQQLGQHQEVYRLSNGRRAKLPPADPLIQEEWLAIAHLDAGRQEGRIYLAAAVDPYDLEDRMELREVVNWDTKKGVLIARTETVVGGLPLESEPLKKIPEPERIRILCEAVRQTPKLLSWTPELEAWQARVLSLRAWRPDDDWPDVSQTGLLATLETWLGPYLTKVNRTAAFQKLDVSTMVASLLVWPQPQTLAQLAPTHFKVPSGSSIRIQYQLDGSPPVLAVRLQEVFGLHETPTVNQGRTRMMIHLLSPARRPVQVTQDLRNFWEHTYAEVRKDLRGRYSKHYWPEDPFTAEAIRGVKPRKK